MFYYNYNTVNYKIIKFDLLSFQNILKFFLSSFLIRFFFISALKLFGSFKKLATY
jgi:hypothetical protein